MGGKDAAIVLADCDLPRTVAGRHALGALERGPGVRRDRDRVRRRAHRRRFVGRWRARGRGSAPARGARRRVAARERRQLDVVEAHVEDALAKGAKLVMRRRAAPGRARLRADAPRSLHRRDGRRARTRRSAPCWPSCASRAPPRPCARSTPGATAWARRSGRGTSRAPSASPSASTSASPASTTTPSPAPSPRCPGGARAPPASAWPTAQWSLLTFCRPKAIVVDAPAARSFTGCRSTKTCASSDDILADAQIGKISGRVEDPAPHAASHRQDQGLLPLMCARA